MQMLKKKAARRALPVIAGVAMIGGMMLPGMAGAATTGSVQVPTQGTASANGTSPTIECAWVLNDSDHNWNSSPQMTYGQDDNPAATPNPTPCTLGTGASEPSQSPTGSVSTIHIDVSPNAHDQPTMEWIELWQAVDYHFGLNHITATNWHVYHPGAGNDGSGTLKVEVHGARHTADCTGPTGMFNAAIATGQVSSAAVNDTNGGMIALCNQGVKSFWYGAFPLSKHQPWGIYKVVADANTDNGGFATMTYYFNVQPTIALDKDFTTVNYGALAPNSDISVAGDLSFSTPGAPTLANRGNAGMQIAIEFDPMCSTDPNAVCTDTPVAWNGGNPTNVNANLKRIDKFDAKFGVNPSNLVTRDPIYAVLGTNADRADFGNPAARNQTLCPNDLGKLDLSVHTGTALWTQNGGGYQGNLTIFASQNTSKQCQTDNGAEYIPVGPDKNIPSNVTNDGNYDGTTPYTNTETH